MSKLQLLVRAGCDVPALEFGERMTTELAPRLLDCTPSDIKLTVTDVPPPAGGVIPFRDQRIALFSVWTDADAEPLARAIAGDDLEVAAYRVVETIPRDYQRDWLAGEPTPGVGLLTVFNRKRGLDDRTFIERWHGGHTPLTLDLHPVWNYVRNVVESEALAGTPHRDAIVEEHFREPEELLNPRIFFGGALAMVPNMLRVWLDVRGFIDMKTLESYFIHEIWLRG